MFLDKEEDNVIQLSSLEDEAAAAQSPEQLHAVYKRLVNFHGELLLMVHWSILAYTGLVKILKKHHKRTGLLVRAPHLDNLLTQPFCSIEVGLSNWQVGAGCEMFAVVPDLSVLHFNMDMTMLSTVLLIKLAAILLLCALPDLTLAIIIIVTCPFTHSPMFR